MPPHPQVPLAGHVRPTLLLLALGLMALEFGVGRLAHRETHDLRESAASLVVAAGQSAIKTLEAGLAAIPFAFVHQYRLLTIDVVKPLGLAGLFLGVEFFYYWQHRAAHRLRWFWASHSVHHSATRLNFTAAVRLGWTAGVAGNFLFFLPLIWLGFDPLAVTAMLGLNLVYQFFIHTELVRSLGPLEWVLNTPAHHRVHHAANAACLDTNYGGVLIVFDRLFGTFAEAPEPEPLRYGLAGVAPSLDPLRIVFGEWLAIGRDLMTVRAPADILKTLFAPPGATKTPQLRSVDS